MRQRLLILLSLLSALALLLAACDADIADEEVDVGDAEDETDEADETDETDDGGDDEAEPDIDEGDAEADPDAESIAWATSDVGSAGHAALVNLSALLNREWEGFQTDVLPTGGAVQSVVGYAEGDFDAYYGANVAFAEIAEDRDRYEGFADDADRMPVQSFWAYPMETGLAIHADNADEFTSWGDLEGEPVFTAPAPWDVRANLEAAMDAIDVGHEYVEVDTGVAGSALDTGDISAMVAYTSSEIAPAPWVVEAELQTDMRILNPTDEEVAEMEDAGFEVVPVSTEGFEGDVGTDEMLLVPFFYGFHVGSEVSEEDVYAMLEVIDENAEELAAADDAFSVLAEGPAELQRRGVASSVDYVEVHPGLASWMEDQGVWDDAWDDRIAE
ncbi:MAG: TAXI family TRAP transporter solute-binding subunit [Actinomycetota bacterium]